MFLEALVSVPYFLNWNTEPDRTLISDSTFDEYYFGNSIFRIHRQWVGFWIRSDHSEANVNVLMLGHIRKYYKNVLTLSWCCYRKMNRFTWKENLLMGFAALLPLMNLGRAVTVAPKPAEWCLLWLAWATYCLQPLFGSFHANCISCWGRPCKTQNDYCFYIKCGLS